jgi:methyl acetate hydrolase
MKRLTWSAVAVAAAVGVAIPLGARQAGSVEAGGRQVASVDLDALLKAAVEQKRVPMVVAMVADGKGVVYEGAHGADKDAIFAIASMTKPITSVAAMQLVEAGKIKLDEPAATYVPEIGAVRVLDNGTLRPPKTPITVRQLLTHTAGFSYEFARKELIDLVAKKQLTSMSAGGDAFLQAPLMSDPGTRWEYGINTDWVGRLVEKVSGHSLEAYFREQIFNPLGMADTYFDVPVEKRARIVPRSQRRADGGLDAQPAPPAKPSTFYSGGGGLFSTASDYLRFVRAMMAGGQLDGHRILSQQLVAEMRKNQIGELTLQPIRSLLPQLAVDRAPFPSAVDKFGLGFAVNSTTTGTLKGVNSMGWAGIYNTFFWIDTEKQVGAVVMSQMLPGMDPGPLKLLEDFERAVYAMKQSVNHR